MNKIKFPIAASFAVLASTCAYAAPNSTGAPTTFVHLFEWSWPDVAKECETFLGPQGYAAVQVSPPNEHITGSQWWTRYQPVSYQLKSRGGDRNAFVDMVSRCKAAGVDIYVDAVINHMAHGSGTGTAGNTFGNKQYPTYSPNDFHQTCAINPEDYGNNAWRVQNCELVGLHDLDTDTPYVQTQLANFLNDLLSVGVAGFRLDASKHMPASDIGDILAKLNKESVVFQEVIDQGSEAIKASDYFQNGLVTEFKYSLKLSETFKTGKLAWLKNFGEQWGFMPSYKAVVFTDNHDNQRGHGGAGSIVTFHDGKLYDLANVFMLAYPYGYPKVMSSYEFNGNTDAGGPTVPVHQGSSLNCNAQQWQCEHRKPLIAGAMRFRNHTNDNWTVSNWWDNGNNQIAFSRGDQGFVAINREAANMSVKLQTGLKPGTYCDELSGGKNANQCAGRTVVVDQDGNAQVSLGAMDAIAIHHQSITDGLPPTGDWQRTVVFIKAETQSGQDMFVRGGLDHNAASQRGVNCQVNPSLCQIPIKHLNLRNDTTAPWKTGDRYLDWQASESGQSAQAQGTALDWTTNQWPLQWGDKKTYDLHGFGESSLNQWGPHYWKLEVEMDCSKTYQGWFELKAYVKNGQGWEDNITQQNRPYASNNHFAKCGMLNMFEFGKPTHFIQALAL
ncbi:alpha-amylase [Pseudoalteromonas luteoviolacea S2607]|uniref:alpha-amylase n=1 Tax=Pseudoalteromonas luteoviolacea TaxID=43657 RepID=UPI0007B0A5BC|nr:alpha-amylase family protein [Pseudoalteromonas luteoviolacea]KZN30146.1 alpha-amylase [Pseudoalteromonas luteoviolacea S2607]